MNNREASHAGSWYTDDGPLLSRQLQSWLDAVPNTIDGVGQIPQPGARIIIAPHAGYSYSGPAAAWAYKCFDLSKCKRIFLLGPSHHLYLPTCALTQKCTSYSTPLGSLPLDTDTLSTLRSTGEFAPLPLPADEAEHSLEMHLPYIYHLLSLSFSSPSEFPGLVPILVGSTSPSLERKYGALLAPYIREEENVFVISSDFCHWGSRFGYTYYVPNPPPHTSTSTRSSTSSSSTQLDPSKGISLTTKSHKHPPSDPPIHESIKKVDRYCMDAVESGSHEAFLDALRRTGNTVCGRHPIGVLMAGLEVLRGEGGSAGDVEEGNGGVEAVKKGRFKFVRYERSGEVKGVGESSVSYASAFAVL